MNLCRLSLFVFMLIGIRQGMVCAMESADTSPLITALINEKFDIARRLLNDASTDIQYRDAAERTALSVAVKSSDSIACKEIVPLLLRNQDLVIHPDAVINAAGYQNAEALRLLLHDARVDVNVRNKDDKTALGEAIQCGWWRGTSVQVGVLKALLSHQKLDVNALTREQCHNRMLLTPLMLAVDTHNVEAVRALLRHPKINTKLVINYEKDVWGTALDLAKVCNNCADGATIIKLLEKYEQRKERGNALLIRQRGIERR